MTARNQIIFGATCILVLSVLVALLYVGFEPEPHDCPEHWIDIQMVPVASPEYDKLYAGAQRACRVVSTKPGIYPKALRGEHLVELRVVDKLTCTDDPELKACAELYPGRVVAQIRADVDLECHATHETMHALLWADTMLAVGEINDEKHILSTNEAHHDTMRQLGVDPVACSR